MPNTYTPQASRSMILNSASVLWATDGTSPFAATSSGYAAATRTLTCSANPPNATPFAAAKVAGQNRLHIGFSTGSVLAPGDYEVESYPSTTTAILKADVRLPTADVAAVRGYVYQTPIAGITGGATVLSAQKECSFMNDCQAFAIDGIEFTFITAAAATLTIYAADGSTVLYDKSFPSGTALGSVYPIAAPNGFGCLGGFSASLGVASTVYIARLLFRQLTRAEVCGLYPQGS